MDDLVPLIRHTLRAFILEPHIRILLYCRRGRHRSVALTEMVAAVFRLAFTFRVQVTHYSEGAWTLRMFRTYVCLRKS